MLPARSISLISVQAPTELNTKHPYQLDVTDDYPSGIIPLAVDHKNKSQVPQNIKDMPAQHTTQHGTNS